MPKMSHDTKIAIWEIISPVIGLVVAFLLFMVGYAIPFLQTVAGFVVVASLFSIPVLLTAGLKKLLAIKK